MDKRVLRWAAVLVLGLAGCSSGSSSDAGMDASRDAGQDDGSGDRTDSEGDAGGDLGVDGGGDPGSTIWHPTPGTTWQWQLDQPVDTSVDVQMVDLDLFETPPATIDTLHGSGRVVICYFSAGSREDWRPDADQFDLADIGSGLQGWPGENWLRITSAKVREIMKARLDLALAKGCDGVEPDNVDGYANDNGLDLTAGDQLDYNRFLANEAHARGLSVGLKNDLDQVVTLEPAFDWALNEECLSYDECAALQPFLVAGKAVFHVEYVDQESQGPAKAAQICGQASIQGFSTLIKTWELTAWRIACP